MNALIFMLLTAVPIDGYQLWKRTQSTQSSKSYTKYITDLKDEALAAAALEADKGEYRYCYRISRWPGAPHTVSEVHDDLMRILGRIPGLSATTGSDRGCVTLDWSQT